MTEKVGSNGSNGSRKNKAWNSDFWLEELSKLSDSHALKSDCWNTSSTILESEQERHYVKDEWDSDIDQEENEQHNEKDKEFVDLDNIHIDWSLSDDDQEEQDDGSSQYNNNNNNTRDDIAVPSPPQRQEQTIHNETIAHFKTASSLQIHRQQEKEDLRVSTMGDKEKDGSRDILSLTSQEKESDGWPINGWSASTSTSLVDVEPISMKLTPVLTPTPIVPKKLPASPTTRTTTETSQIFLNEKEEHQKVVDDILESSIKLSNKESIGHLDFSLLDSGDDDNEDDDGEGDEDGDDESNENERYQEEGTQVVGMSISNRPLATLDNNGMYTSGYDDDNKLSASQQLIHIQDTNVQTDHENVNSTSISEKKSETTVKLTPIQMDTTNHTKKVHSSPSKNEQDSLEIKLSGTENAVTDHDDTSSTALSVVESNVEDDKISLTLEDNLTTIKSTSNPSAAEVVEIKSQRSIVSNQLLTPLSSSSTSSTAACIHDSADDDRTEPGSPTKLDLSGENERDSSIKQPRTLAHNLDLLEQEKKEEFARQMKEDTLVMVMKQMNNDERAQSTEKEHMKGVQNTTVSNTSTDDNQEKCLENNVDKEKEPSIKVDTLLLKDQEKPKEDKNRSESPTSENRLPMSPSVEKSSTGCESSMSIWANAEGKLDEKSAVMAAAITTTTSSSSSAKSSPEIKDQQGSAFSIWAQPTEKPKEGESAVTISTALSATLSPKTEQQGTKLSMWAPPEEKADERLVVTTPSTIINPKIEQHVTVAKQSGSEEKTGQQQRKAGLMSSTASSLEDTFVGSVENSMNQQGDTHHTYATVDTKVDNQDRRSSCSSSLLSAQPTGTIASIWSPVRRTTINMSKPQEDEDKKPVSPFTQQPTTNVSPIWSSALPAKRITIQKEEQTPLSSPKNQIPHVAPSTSWSPASSPTVQNQQIASSPSVQREKAAAYEPIWTPAPPTKSISIQKEQKSLSPSREQQHFAKIYSSANWSPAPSSSSSSSSSSSTAIQEEQNSLSASTKQKMSTTDDSVWSPGPPTKSITIQQETKGPLPFTLQATAPEFSWNPSEAAKPATTATIPCSMGQEQGQGDATTSALVTAATTTTPTIGATTKTREQQQNIATDWSSSAASIWNPKPSETITQQEPLSITAPRSSSTAASNEDNITTEESLTFDYQLYKIQEDDSDEEDGEDEEESDSEDDDEEESESASEYNSDSDDNSVEQITINLASLVQAKKEEQKKKEPPVIRCTLSDLILGMESEKIRNILDELSGKTSFANVSPSTTTMTTTTTTAQEEQVEHEEHEEQGQQLQQNGIHPPSSLSLTTSTSLSNTPPSSTVETKRYTHEQHQGDKKEPTLSSLDGETKRKTLEKAKQVDNNLKLSALAPSFTPPTFVPESITSSTDCKQSDSDGENVEDEEVFHYVPEQEEEHQQKESIATVSLPYNQHLTPQQQADLLSTPKYFESDDQPQQKDQQRQYTSSSTIQHYPKTFIPSVLSTPAALSQHPSLETRVQSNTSMITNVVNGVSNDNNHYSYRSTDLDLNYSTFNRGGTLYFQAPGSPSSPSLSTASNDIYNNNNTAPLLKTPTSRKIKISAPDSAPSFSSKSNTDKFNIGAPTFNPSNFRP